MTRHLLVSIACVLTLAACSSDSGDPFTSLTSAASLATTNNMMEETGDGDGDGGPGTGEGDGDGDPTAGDGDGDGDGGDGDGDGDGDAGDGDGDGDLPSSCGWFEDPDFPGYYCGGSGEDPNGAPIACPPNLVDGGPCGSLTGEGCCDGEGNNWYCGQDDVGNQAVVFEACG